MYLFSSASFQSTETQTLPQADILTFDSICTVIDQSDLNSKKSIAMHYQTFKLSSENFDDPIIDLENEKKLKKISSEFIALDVGKKLILN